LPVVVGLVAAGIMMAVYGTTAATSVLFFVVMSLAGAVVSVVTSQREQRQYDVALARERNHYQQAIEVKRIDLADENQTRSRLVEELDPPPPICLERARNLDYRLGERRPADPDFVSLRLGLGTRTSGLTIHAPSEDDRDERFATQYQLADDLPKAYATLPKSPILADLKRIGGLGLAGERSLVRDTARACVGHLVTHHWPTELNVAVVCSSVAVEAQWAWVRDLPHRTRILSQPVFEYSASHTELVQALETELHRRRALLQQELATHGVHEARTLPALLVVFDHIDAARQEAAFALILKEGLALNVYALVLADSFAQVPAECNAVLEISESRAEFNASGPLNTPLVLDHPDRLSITEAKTLASLLARVPWATAEAVTTPPAALTLMDLFAVDDPTNLPVADWWDGRPPFGFLRAPIGRLTASANLVLDLNESNPHGETHGPHGVIGGMTGSGKSEFLRTLILSLAVTHHPYDVNFALVDYKGGGAFKDLERLPHVVGVITDIETHAAYAGRVIESLAGEIQTRKQILVETQQAAGLDRAHVDDYQSLPVKRPLPRLIVIFDEFAEFRDQHAEESRKLINIARQGRSLGVHLILCTQNPAAAIDQQVRQNAKFAISLNVNSPEDSRSLIGIPDAFGLPKGRGYISVTSPQLFQAAYCGTHVTTGSGQGRTQAEALITKLLQTHQELGLEPPPRVWPDPLKERVYLPDLLRQQQDAGIAPSWNGRTWDVPGRSRQQYPLGLFDDPAHQSQPIYYFGAANGRRNLLILGPARSGKSTLLLTLAMAIAQSNSPSQAHIYWLDLGGSRVAHQIEGLPQLPVEGGVIRAHDIERINALFSTLRAYIAQRQIAFQLAPAGVTNLEAYNRHTPPDRQFPTLYVLIDGVTSSFTGLMDSFAEQLTDVLLNGASLGLSVVLTANLAQDVPPKVFSYMTDRLVLQPAERSHIDAVVDGPYVQQVQTWLSHELPPGRGVLGGQRALLFQAALPVEGAMTDDQAHQLSQIVSAMREGWTGPRPAPIKILARRLSRRRLYERHAELSVDQQIEVTAPLIGLRRDGLMPVGLSLGQDGPSFLVSSATARQGKTTALLQWVLGLAELFPPSVLQLLIIDFHRHTLRHLRRLPHVQGGRYVAQRSQLEDSLNWLSDIVHEREAQLERAFKEHPEASLAEVSGRCGYLLVVIDDYAAFRLKSDPSDQLRLAELCTRGEDCGVRIAAADTLSLLGPAYNDPFLKMIQRSRCGLYLGAGDDLDSAFDGVKIPAQEKTLDFPIGRGYLVRKAAACLVQIAVDWEDLELSETAISERIQSLTQRYSSQVP